MKRVTKKNQDVTQKKGKMVIPVSDLRHPKTIPTRKKVAPGTIVSIPNRFGCVEIEYVTGGYQINATDMKTFWAVFNLAKNKPLVSKKRNITMREICDVLKLKKSGKSYKRIRTSLVKLSYCKILPKTDIWLELGKKEIRGSEIFIGSLSFVTKKWTDGENEEVEIQFGAIYEEALDKPKMVFNLSDSILSLEGISFNLGLFFLGQGIGDKKRIFLNDDIKKESLALLSNTKLEKKIDYNIRKSEKELVDSGIILAVDRKNDKIVIKYGNAGQLVNLREPTGELEGTEPPPRELEGTVLVNLREPTGELEGTGNFSKSQETYDSVGLDVGTESALNTKININTTIIGENKSGGGVSQEKVQIGKEKNSEEILKEFFPSLYKYIFKKSRSWTSSQICDLVTYAKTMRNPAGFVTHRIKENLPVTEDEKTGINQKTKGFLELTAKRIAVQQMLASGKVMLKALTVTGICDAGVTTEKGVVMWRDVDLEKLKRGKS